MNETREQLVKKDEELNAFWRSEARAANGNDLRSETAKANMREIERQRKAIWDAIRNMK